MWIVQLALRRPYTFVVMAILIGSKRNSHTMAKNALFVEAAFHESAPLGRTRRLKQRSAVSTQTRRRQQTCRYEDE